MTLREYVLTKPCIVDGCEDASDQAYPVSRSLVPLCLLHMLECEKMGRDAFELRYRTDFAQTAAGYGEAFYHAEVQRLREALK